MDDTEEKPFLDEHKELSMEQHYLHPRQRSMFCNINLCALLVHVCLILMYTGWFVATMRRSEPPRTALHPIDDLNLRYIPQTYTDFEKSEYAGPPSPSVDKAWHELLSKTAIRVSASELKRSNQSSVELPVGGGHMAWLGVYHQLHCIKMLRQWNYREHYHPNLKPADRPHWDIHADHCLDILRSAAMCHGDTTLTTFGWLDQDKPMLNTRPIQHKCVDWGALMESVQRRIVSEQEVAALENPNLKESHS